MNAVMRMAASENAAMKASYGKGMVRDLDRLLSDLHGHLSDYDRKDMMVFVEDVCKEAGVESFDVISKQRHQPIARIRQYCVWTLMQERFTPKQIQALFQFDRACVPYSVKKIDGILGT